MFKKREPTAGPNVLQAFHPLRSPCFSYFYEPNQAEERMQTDAKTHRVAARAFFFFLLQVQKSTAEEVTHLQAELKANITRYHQHSFRQW